MKIILSLILLLVFTASGVYAWQAVENLGSPPNSSDWEYQCSVDNSGDKVFLVIEDPIAKIAVTELNGSWSWPSTLPEPINSPGATYPFWDSNNSDLYFCGDSDGDIWYCHWNGSEWEGTKYSVGTEINSGVNEFSPCLSPDGNYFYFTRNGDIYVADWDSGSHTGSNVRLTGIGSGYLGSYHDGYLYFHSNCAGGYGENDIWKAEGSGSNFSIAENLGPDINTSDIEGSPTWTTNGSMFFCSDRPGGYGNPDLYKADYNVAVQPTSLGSIKAMFH